MKLRIGDIYRLILKIVPQIIEALIKLEAGQEVTITSKELNRLGIEIVIRKRKK